MDQASVLLISVNQAKAKSLHLTPAAPELSIGRAPDNQGVISDQRCSSKHCKVSLSKTAEGEPEVQVEDTSSNGTYVNAKRVLFT
jgi:pSer/pThr/pTyr-binding forkhead associated (FHA) protein